MTLAVKPPLRSESDALRLSRPSRKVEAHSGLHQDRSGVRGPHRQVAMPVEKEPFKGARSRFCFDRANRRLITVPSHVSRNGGASNAIRTVLAEYDPTWRVISSTPSASTRNGFRFGVNSLSPGLRASRMASRIRGIGMFSLRPTRIVTTPRLIDDGRKTERRPIPAPPGNREEALLCWTQGTE